jgi:hypothetical protein
VHREGDQKLRFWWWVASLLFPFADETEKLTFLLPLFKERGTAFFFDVVYIF